MQKAYYLSTPHLARVGPLKTFIRTYVRACVRAFVCVPKFSVSV